MSVQVLADTHALIWYLFDEERLSPSGLAALDGAIEPAFPSLCPQFPSSRLFILWKSTGSTLAQ